MRKDSTSCLDATETKVAKEVERKLRTRAFEMLKDWPKEQHGSLRKAIAEILDYWCIEMYFFAPDVIADQLEFLLTPFDVLFGMNDEPDLDAYIRMYPQEVADIRFLLMQGAS